MKLTALLTLMVTSFPTLIAAGQSAPSPPIPAPCAAAAPTLSAAPAPLEARAPRLSEPLWRAHITGTVRLRLSVDPGGTVNDVCLLQSVNALADRFAAQAARLWRFPPAAVTIREATITITYAFEEAPSGLGPGPTGVVFEPPFGVRLLAAPLPPQDTPSHY